MPQPNRPSDRTAAERRADHAGLARLSETLVPALVAKLNASGLGELEVREGNWKVRLRRPVAASGGHRRPDRGRPAVPPAEGRDGPTRRAGSSIDPNGPADTQRVRATSPAVGIFKPGVSVGSKVRQGDRLATVDLLGIPQDVVAPIDWVLVEVFVEAGDVVEYGEEIAAVEARASESTDGTAKDGEGPA
jgi:biotin carboxyl carrier protein